MSFPYTQNGQHEQQQQSNTVNSGLTVNLKPATKQAIESCRIRHQEATENQGFDALLGHAPASLSHMASTDKYIALYDFVARNPDELSFRKADILVVPETGATAPDDEWVMLQSTQSNEVGLVPLNYIALQPKVESMTFGNTFDVEQEQQSQLDVQQVQQSQLDVQQIPLDVQQVQQSQLDVQQSQLDVQQSQLDVQQAQQSQLEVQQFPLDVQQAQQSQLEVQQFPLDVQQAQQSQLEVQQFPSRSQQPIAACSLGQPSFQCNSTTQASLRTVTKVSGYATDVIAIKSKDGCLFCTSFNVRFKGLPKGTMNVNGEPVSVFVDGKLWQSLNMLVDTTGRCRVLSQDDDVTMTRELAGLCSSGQNEFSITFQFSSFLLPEARHVVASLWVFPFSDSFMVSDVDGTITKNDLGGLFNTALRMKAGFKHTGYAHQGTCHLFNHIVQETGCRVLYLTARPLNLMNETRAYINSLKQVGLGLPQGPIVSDSTSYLGSIRREVFDKSSHEFKTRFLLELQNCFVRAGRNVNQYPLYLACFGNKETDGIAYLAAGARPETTFLINSKSQLRTVGYHPSQGQLQCYDDPRVISWLEQLMKLLRDGNLPMPP